jgi:hypothetical protein
VAPIHQPVLLAIPAVLVVAQVMSVPAAQVPLGKGMLEQTAALVVIMRLLAVVAAQEVLVLLAHLMAVLAVTE